MTQTNPSLQERLLCGNEAEKEATFEEILGNICPAFVQYFVTNHSYTEAESVDLFHNSWRYLYTEFIWNDDIKEIMKDSRKQPIEIRRYAYLYFLKITQNIEETHNWNILENLIYIATHKKQVPFFLDANILKMEQPCQLLIGDKALKDTILIPYYDVVKKATVNIFRNKYTIFSTDELESLGVDAFFKFKEEVLPTEIKQKKMQQTVFYLSLLIKKKIQTCKEFNIQKYVIKISENLVKQEHRRKTQYENIAPDIIDNNQRIKTKYFVNNVFDNEPDISFDFQQEKRKAILIELYATETEHTKRNIELETFDTILSQIKHIFSAKRTKKEIKKEIEALTEKQNNLFKDYFQTLETAQYSELILKAVLENFDEKHKEIIMAYNLKKKKEKVEEIAEEFETTKQTIYDTIERFKTFCYDFEQNLADFLNNQLNLSTKKHETFLRQIRTLIDLYDKHYDQEDYID